MILEASGDPHVSWGRRLDGSSSSRPLLNQTRRVAGQGFPHCKGLRVEDPLASPLSRSQ